MLCESAWGDESFCEEGMDECKQKMGIVSGANKMMFIGLLRRSRAIGVNDYHFPTTLPQSTQPTTHIRCSHQAAVGDKRICSQQQQIFGTFQIRDRNRKRGPEHESGSDLLRHLVDS